MSEPQSAVPANVRPTIEDPRAWNAFWAAQGMSWRTAPELSSARHAYFAERRAIIPGIPQGIYPFKGVEPKLTRAEIECCRRRTRVWVLVELYIWKYPQASKPLQNERRNGLDPRGADLSELNLSKLPLTCLQGGPSSVESLSTTEEQRRTASVLLVRADLSYAHLEKARLPGGPSGDALW